jgi:hypothetical protein
METHSIVRERILFHHASVSMSNPVSMCVFVRVCVCVQACGLARPSNTYPYLHPDSFANYVPYQNYLPGWNDMFIRMHFAKACGLLRYGEQSIAKRFFSFSQSLWITINKKPTKN